MRVALRAVRGARFDAAAHDGMRRKAGRHELNEEPRAPPEQAEPSSCEHVTTTYVLRGKPFTVSEKRAPRARLWTPRGAVKHSS